MSYFLFLFHIVHILHFILLQCVSILFAFVEQMFSWKLEWLPDLNIQICLSNVKLIEAILTQAPATFAYLQQPTCHLHKW